MMESLSRWICCRGCAPARPANLPHTNVGAAIGRSGVSALRANKESPAAMFDFAHAAGAHAFFVSPKKACKERRLGENLVCSKTSRTQLPQTPTLGQGQVRGPGSFCTGDITRCNCARTVSGQPLYKAATMQIWLLQGTDL